MFKEISVERRDLNVGDIVVTDVRLTVRHSSWLVKYLWKCSFLLREGSRSLSRLFVIN